MSLNGIQEHVDKHCVEDWENLGVKFQDGRVWIWELEDVKEHSPPVPYVHKKGHQVWVTLKPEVKGPPCQRSGNGKARKSVMKQ